MTQDELREWLNRLDEHYPGERAHGERVAVYAVAAAQRLGWGEEELSTLRFAAALHDVGKLALLLALLERSGPLSEGDFETLRTHPALAAEQLAGALGPIALAWIRGHHERWDGKGYPDGLAGEAIPLGARLIAAAETLDVLLHDGRWRSKLSEPDALEEVRQAAGSQLDPKVVDALLEVQPLIQPVG